MYIAVYNCIKIRAAIFKLTNFFSIGLNIEVQGHQHLIYLWFTIEHFSYNVSSISDPFLISFQCHNRQGERAFCSYYRLRTRVRNPTGSYFPARQAAAAASGCQAATVAPRCGDAAQLLPSTMMLRLLSKKINCLALFT